MSNHHLPHLVKHGADAIRDLQPLGEHKSPAVAFAMGLALGAVGVAAYFKSAKDFFICIGMFIGLTILMPVGPGEVLGWLFAPAYGAWRAHTSNENLGL